MELVTNRLRITPCTEELLQTHLKIEDYKIGSHIPMYIEQLKEDADLLGWGVWFVFLQEDGTLIGDIGFKGMPDSEGTIEVGYGIVPEFQNKGYATESVSEIIKWAFSFDGVKRIVAECHDDNSASIRVLEKLNMKRTIPTKNMLKWEVNNPSF